MTTPRATALGFGLVLLSVGAVYFMVVRNLGRPRLDALAPEPPLVIRHTTDAISLDPDAPQWSAVAPLTVHLYPQDARAPFGTEERDVRVSGVYTDDALAFRLQFADTTENRDSTSAPDACAIMLVPDTGAAVEQMMGHDATANIWHWRADLDAAHARPGGDTVRAIRELLATGPGTQGLMPMQTVTGRGAYQDGTWSVVFERRLGRQQDGELDVTPSQLAIAFAVWDGALGERLSKKSISLLRPLRLEAKAHP